MTYVDLRYSKDGGHNWSDWKRRERGEVGAFCKRIVIRRMGRGRQWVFQFRDSSDSAADVIAASIQVEG